MLHGIAECAVPDVAQGRGTFLTVKQFRKTLWTALLEPEHEGIMIFQTSGTVQPITQCDSPEYLRLHHECYVYAQLKHL